MLRRSKTYIILLGLLTVVYCLIEAFGEGDLYIYLCAAGVLREGGDIYTTGYISGQYHYYYSVFFAWLLLPFYGLPFYAVKFFWLLLNAALFWHLGFLLYRSSLLRDVPAKKRNLFMLLLFIFSLRFFHENIHASQITILIFWCCVYGIFLIAKGNNAAGSFILALGINIKLLPLLFIPYLLYRARYRAIFYTIDWLLILFLLPSVLVGHNYNKVLLGSWWQLINPANKQHVLDVAERSFHGLSTLLATLLVENVPDKFAMDLKRNIADISHDSLHTVLTVTRLFLCGLLLVIIRSKPFSRVKDPWQSMLEVSYILLLIPLVFPHQQHYAFLFTVPAFGILLYYHLFNGSGRKWLGWVLLLIYLVSNLKLLLGEFNQYYEHYKILTYAALALVPLLTWLSGKSRPKTL